jgi:transcription initiation factor TFIID TATA-box-binding protein
LSEDIELFHVHHKTGSGPGLYLKFDEDSPTVILSTSGKYIITGADSLNILEETQQRLFELLNSLEMDTSRSSSPVVNNMVYTGELEAAVDLNALSIGLGLENVEYEPEQFPGIIFRPQGAEAVLLIFSSGKVVITGVTSEQSAADAFERLRTKIDEVFK